MANLLTDFLSSLSLLNLGLAFLGVLAGIIIGALPGLSATMAVAILVPFTFALEPSSGLIVLGAIYTGAIFGGSWSAILINTARGEVVDDNALILALKSKEISAVGLDVFNNEPNINPELMKFENAILLPHLGSATQETREAMGFRVLDNIADFFEGKVPRDKVA